MNSSLLDPYYDPEADTQTKRNRLPHWQQEQTWTFVTWRLGDSLPKGKLKQWRAERAAWLERHPEPWDTKTEVAYHDQFTHKIDEWLDQGSGSCVLGKPENASILAGTLKHFNQKSYKIASFVVMPNHLHVLFQPLAGTDLARIVQSWKGYSAREINKQMGTKGSLWQEDYWDHLIRNESHFFKVAEYIRENPVKARLSPDQFLLWEAERGLSSPRDLL